MQLACGQIICAKHARLFVCGDERFDGAVLQVLCFHHRHDSGNANAIVGTQGGVARAHPSFFIDISLQRIGLEIVLALGTLLWHHVHVSLHEHGLSIFHAGCGWFTHYHVVSCIDKSFDTCLLGKIEQELLYGF